MLSKNKRIIIIFVVSVIVVVGVVIGVSYAVGQSNVATKPSKSNKQPKLILGSFNQNLGFFSNLVNVFNMISMAEKNGYRPVVVLNNGPYTENRPNMQPENYDANNWFNNYFKSIGENSAKYIDKLGKLPVFPRHAKKYHLYEYNFKSLQNTYNVLDVENHRRIWKKYFVVLPFILEKVEKLFKELPSAGVLGIFYRGTDTNGQKKESVRNTAYSSIRVAAQKELEKNPLVSAIFISSDEQPFVDYLQSKNWSVPTFCSGAIRSSKNTSLVKKKNIDSKDTVHLGLKNCNRFLKGQDVLVDALILSKCYKIIATKSSMLHFLKVVNPDIELKII